MVQFIVNLIGPVLYGMGVSEADLIAYVTMVENYLYAILAALILMVAAMMAASRAKKGMRHVIRWSSLISFVLVLTLIVNLMCFGPLYANISGALNAKSVELNADTAQQSRDTVKQIGEEGMVLVKNDGLLPLSKDVTALNVFGWGSICPVLGGTGSGSSDGSSAIDILQSLHDAGYQTNDELSQMYRNYVHPFHDYQGARPTTSMQMQDLTLIEPTAEYYTDSLMSHAASFSDTAVIVIGRSGGEGADLPKDMNAVIKGTYNVAPANAVAADGGVNRNYSYTKSYYFNNGSYDDFDPGEHYLQLSNTEEAMIERVCSTFEHVIVVVNANNAMELGWVDQYDAIGAVILAPGTGATGMAALGEIINGTVNPSGRTADTYVYDLTDTPTFNNFGNYSYTNLKELKQAIAQADAAYEGNIAFVNYVENIYVGYKFYETAAEEGFLNYTEHVLYPFGYGLSYTTFTQQIKNFKDLGHAIQFDVTVTNTGGVAGKDVVEVYFTPPYTNGGIEKASVNLIDYGKTGILEPKASETISFTIEKEDMASYDTSGIGGYVLEAGEYTISIRADSHTVIDKAAFKVAEDVDYRTNGRSSDHQAANNQFHDYAAGNVTYLSRADGFANYAEATSAPAESMFVMDEDTRAVISFHSSAYYDPTLLDNDGDVMPTLGANNGLTLADLAGKPYDDPKWEELLDQLSFSDMVTMINIGGWQTAEIASVGKVATSDCDGPAGLSNFITGVYGTAYPTEVLMAQTWNPELALIIGASIGAEFREANNFGWYGPAMNTHRSAFAGRNFEYFSEDGVLAGKFAAAEVNGAATQGVYCYIKHFAVNDQETNRCSFLLTYSNEQAIREIYLKPFEMIVKGFQGTALACMSSYNFIGSVPCCENPNLLNHVLRGEWGFVGMVETDYNGSYGYMHSDHAVRSGNDLMLGYGRSKTNAFTDQSATIAQAMRQSCKNILYTIGNSGYYVSSDGTIEVMESSNAMQNLFITMDVIVGLLCLAVEALVMVLYLKKKKAGKYT